MQEVCKQCLGLGQVLTEANSSGGVINGGLDNCYYCLGSARLLSHISKRTPDEKDLAISRTVALVESQFRRKIKCRK